MWCRTMRSSRWTSATTPTRSGTSSSAAVAKTSSCPDTWARSASLSPPQLARPSPCDAAVRTHLDEQESVKEYVDQVAAFLDAWLPRFESETRSYLTVAFGCTGGRHRSVYLAERLAQFFRERGRQDVLTYHRELE